MKTKMVFYGDSIIRGKTWQENAPKPIDTKKNFVEYCRHCLDSFGIEVVNKGVNGRISKQACLELEDEVLKLKPNYVVLEIGGNDSNFNWKEVSDYPDKDHKPVATPTEFRDNLISILDKLEQEKITVILLTPPPLAEEKYFSLLKGYFGDSISPHIQQKGGIANFHKQYVDVIREVAEERELFLIDIYQEFENIPDYKVDLIGKDGLHPSEKGYKLMAQIFMKSIGYLFLQNASQFALIS